MSDSSEHDPGPDRQDARPVREAAAPERGSLWREPGQQEPASPVSAADMARSPINTDQPDTIYNKMLGRSTSGDSDPSTTNHKQSAAPLVRLVDVHKSFGSNRVLDGVSLDIYPGKTTVIIGPSGTGKSVLLKHIAGLLKPDAGEVWFEDQRVDRLSENSLVAVRQQMGMLFQMGALFDSMNVAENIMFPLLEHNRKMSAAQRMDRCRMMLRIVGLKNVEKKMPANLSGGQRKRVALARAIILEPKLVLYDEPTTGLDPIRSDVINELILSLTQHLGIASIVVTHDMASADKIADRMVMLYDGKVVIDGSPEAFHRTDNDLVRRFIKGEADHEDLEAIREGIEPVARQ
jgi:phospholipid/cholesterol/gamma-HCH transport system ATP-binding protein